MDMNQRLSVALLKRASELGDPEAQGQMGLRYSLGLQDPLSWGQDGIIGFEEVSAIRNFDKCSPKGCPHDFMRRPYIAQRLLRL